MREASGRIQARSWITNSFVSQQISDISVIELCSKRLVITNEALLQSFQRDVTQKHQHTDKSLNYVSRNAVHTSSRNRLSFLFQVLPL